MEAIRQLEPFFGGFLYTHVDREGLLQGTDMRAIRAVRAATTREVIAAGGITTMEEVDELDAMGVDAVVGMALYTGRLAMPKPPATTRPSVGAMLSSSGVLHRRASFSRPDLSLPAACSREPGLFNDTNALAHVSMLAGTIGSRPVGSPANARAREYIVDQLKQIGFEVRVQETDARRHELGRTARVANIIGILPGERPRRDRPGLALRLVARCARGDRRWARRRR